MWMSVDDEVGLKVKPENTKKTLNQNETLKHRDCGQTKYSVLDSQY